MGRFLQSIYFKIISICFIMFLLIAGMIGIIRNKTNRAIQEEYLKALSGSFSVTVASLEREVENAVMTLYVISASDDVRQFLYNYEVLSLYERQRLCISVKELFSQFMFMNGMIRDVGIVTGAQERGISCLGDEKTPDFFAGPADALFYQRNDRVFLVKGEVRRNVSVRPLFYIELEERYFDALTEQIRAVVPGAELLFMEKDTVIYQTEGMMLDAEELLKQNEAGLTEPDSFLKNGWRFFAYPIYLNSLKVYIGYEDHLMAEPIEELNRMNYVVMLVLTGQALLLMFYINYVLNKPMKRLVSLMEEAGKGNLEAGTGQYRKDQFGFIFEGFRKMMDDLKTYIRLNYDQQLEIERSELRQLQAQINPHFLYNCFFNISNLCKIEDVEMAGIFSERLAHYYMYITRNHRDVVMLREEYEHAKCYLDIQKIRFHNRVEVRLEELPLKQEILRVPRFILQPVLENCYKYVFERSEKRGVVWMHTVFEDQVLWIFIEDSGLENDKADIRQITQRLEEKGSIENTGLINVSRRLELMASGSGLKVEHSALGGLCVILRIGYGREHVSDLDCGR